MTDTNMSTEGKSAETANEWVVRARCVITKEFVIRGTQEQAEALEGEILDEIELEQVDSTVLALEPNK